MTDLQVDRKFIEECLRSFTPQELVAYKGYLARLLSNGLLMREDAEEAACHRVVNERGNKL
jgi:hypothetical protein